MTDNNHPTYEQNLSNHQIVQAALLVEVAWGVIPGTVEGNRQWGWSREQVDAAESWQTLMDAAYKEYNKRLDPRQNNWVKLEWLWL